MLVTRTLNSGIRALTSGSDGNHVILFPEWPQTAEAFLTLLPLLSSHHQVYVLDPPDLGQSAAPSGGDYTSAALSKILHEAVATIIRTPFHLVGHDVGAWIAYAWACQFPTSILNLTLLDSAIPDVMKQQQYPLPQNSNVKLWQFSFNALPDLPEVLTEGRERQPLDWSFERKSIHPERITKEMRNHYMQQYSRPGAMSRGFAYFRAVMTIVEQNQKFLETQGLLKMPVLALGGSSGIRDVLRSRMQEYTERVEGGVIEDCGHYVMEEQADVVGQRLRDFFARVDTQ